MTKDSAIETKQEKAKAKAKEKKPGVFSKIKRYFKDLRGEFKKIVWPSKKQIINNSIVVIVMVVLSAVVIGGFDTLLGLLLKLCFGS